MKLAPSSRLWLLCIAVLLAAGQARPTDPDRYAGVVERILDAWKTADVVCLGEDHGREYDSELRLALVRHADFPRTVRVIVVEMANPVHQPLLDRFILDGASMSREELAVVWRDASGAEVWESPIYEEFLRAVQTVNARLPREQRMRVLGGDSPIDCQYVQDPADLVPLVNRGGNIRRIIATQVLDQHLKGLAIYGASHCNKVGGGFPGDLRGTYDPTRMWSIEPFLRAAGAQKASALFGFGKEPQYTVITGTEWAARPAADLLPVRPGFALGDVLDATVYHGAVPDSVVRADLTVLNAKYAAEFQRRRMLIDSAFALWRRR